MSLQTHILTSSVGVKKYKKEIELAVANVVNSIEKILPIGDIDVVFYDNPEFTIRELGIGGFTPIANTVFIYFDPRNPNLEKSIKKDIEYTIAHEINHAIRFRTPIEKETLLEAAISEGLADHFAVQITGSEAAEWTRSLSEEKEKEMLERMRVEWDNVPYDHNSWFYGSETKDIPRWAAYTIGFNLVKRYLESHSEIKASDIISSDASLFV